MIKIKKIKKAKNIIKKEVDQDLEIKKIKKIKSNLKKGIKNNQNQGQELPKKINN